MNKKLTIVCDQGHGGADSGATNKGLYEKAATLAIGKILRDKLKALGHNVIMTREEDKFVTLANRCKISNQANAQLFISIHLNSAENKTAQGIETWKYVGSNNPYAANIQKRLIEATSAKNRGVKDGNFYVLRGTKCKAVLVECGFISNEQEKLLLFKTSYQTKIAEAIAQGVQDVLSDTK